MPNPLIINARGQLGWHRRFFSDATTLALWGMWLWLCRPVVMVASGMFGSFLGVKHVPFKLAMAAPAFSLEGTALALASTSCLLLLWGRLPSQPPKRPLLTATPDYAGFFGLDGGEIAKARESSICVVHHDEQGRITHIVNERSASERSPGSPGNP